MSFVVDRKNKYISNMPVVGVTPNVYSFNNISSILDPYMGINELQFYNPLTGQLGPNYKTSSFVNNMNNTMNSSYITSSYNNNGISVDITGTQSDVDKVKSILNTNNN